LKKKNYSSVDRIDGTNGYFRWNSGCSAEQKTLGIPFRTLPRRKQLEIPFCGTKIEANSRNLFRTILRKRKKLGIPFHATKVEANSWNAMHSEEGRENNKMRQPKIKKIVSEKTTFEVRPNNLLSYFGCFVKLIFSAEFRSLPSGIIRTKESLVLYI
jgi:hypothetical protein